MFFPAIVSLWLSPGYGQKRYGQRRVLAFLFLGLGLGSCGTPGSPPDPFTNSDRSHCVTDYDPQRNYFETPVTLDAATGFTVDYHGHYKVITVSTPWAGSKQAFRYLLVQCGTPMPDGFEDAQWVSIPIQTAMVLSSTHIPFFDQLEALDTLIAVRQPQDISHPWVREQIQNGTIAKVGNANDLDFETIVSLQPDLVTTFGIANVETSSINRLQELGLATAVIGEYLEKTPLGQAEWIKFIAPFLNKEAQAEAKFAAIAQRYQDLKALTQDIPDSDRPSVLTGFNLEGTWYVAGGQSFIAQFIQDAGGNYLWSENPSSGNVPLDFEAVFAKATDAAIWLNVNQNWQTLEDALGEDPRYGNFLALQTGQVFNNDARLNSDRGNDYWESGILNPHIVLADLIKILHPERLPEHELYYYRSLGCIADPSLVDPVNPNCG